MSSEILEHGENLDSSETELPTNTNKRVSKLQQQKRLNLTIH